MIGLTPVLRSAGLAGVMLVLLTGCAKIESFVTGDPAEKEYKAATKLPPLEIPPEMNRGTFAGESSLLIPGVDNDQNIVYSAREGAIDNDQRRQAEAISSIYKDENQVTSLRINGGSANAWNEVRGALAELGVEIYKMDRERGIYEVEYPLVGEIDRGVIDRLTFWDNDEPPLVEIKLVIENLGEPTTFVRAYDGDELDNSVTATALLESIQRQLNPVSSEAIIVTTQPDVVGQPFVPDGTSTTINAFNAAVPATFEVSRYVLEQNSGVSRIVTEQDFARTWREVGMAIVDEELPIVDRDRSRGLYFVTDIDLDAPKGGFFSWGNDEPQTITRLIAVQPLEVGGNQVLVFDEDEKLDNSAGASALLPRLLQQLP